MTPIPMKLEYEDSKAPGMYIRLRSAEPISARSRELARFETAFNGADLSRIVILGMGKGFNESRIAPEDIRVVTPADSLKTDNPRVWHLVNLEDGIRLYNYNLGRAESQQTPNGKFEDYCRAASAALLDLRNGHKVTEPWIIFNELYRRQLPKMVHGAMTFDDFFSHTP